MKRFAWSAIGLALVGAAATRPAEAQWGRMPSSPAATGGRNTAISPYANPFLNPYANPYLYNAPRGGVGAAMVFMSGQQAMAQAAQQRAEAARERESPRGAVRSRMDTPGGGASRYFGGGGGPVGPADEASNSQFQRHNRYFRPNG